MRRNVKASPVGRQIFFPVDVFLRIGAIEGMKHGNPPAVSGTPWKTIFLAAAFAALLFFFPPSQFSFYPRCLFHAVTGWDCPGCGSLRSAHQLLHGNFKMAFALNPLFVLGIPLFAFLAAQPFVRGTRPATLARTLAQPRLLWPLVAIAIAFGIFRNTPLFTELVR